MLRHPPLSTLFPYTTLFRSLTRPPLTDFISVPCKTIPASYVSSIKYSCDALRFCAMAFPFTFGIVRPRSEEHTSELQSRGHLVCRLLLEKKKKKKQLNKKYT